MINILFCQLVVLPLILSLWATNLWEPLWLSAGAMIPNAFQMSYTHYKSFTCITRVNLINFANLDLALWMHYEFHMHTLYIAVICTLLCIDIRPL